MYYHLPQTIIKTLFCLIIIINNNNYKFIIKNCLVADLAVRGLWHSQSEALLDIRVVDTDADSYCHRPVAAVIKSAEEEKKRKYNEAVEARRG